MHHDQPGQHSSSIALLETLRKPHHGSGHTRAGTLIAPLESFPTSFRSPNLARGSPSPDPDCPGKRYLSIYTLLHTLLHMQISQLHRLQYSILSPVNSTSHAHRPAPAPFSRAYLSTWLQIARSRVHLCATLPRQFNANPLPWPTLTEFASSNNTKRGPSLPIVTPPTHRFSVPV